MYIVIGADIVPSESNVKLFEQSQLEELVGEDLLTFLHNADFNIFNLEVPLTNIARPISKQGICMMASTKSVVGMSNLGINLFTLANNHIMDQDEQGLNSTFNTLSKAGIACVGAGDNLEEARKPFFFVINGKRYGIYACAEHEFSIATDECPGANPFDPLESLDDISKMKLQCDYAVVLYHGGKEYYRYPSPQLQKVCRKIIEKGANLVVCQHSHCIGCKEEYNNGTIIYGQGNFIFDGDNDEYWNTSLLLKIDESLNIDYGPIKKIDNVVRIAEENEAKIILDEFLLRSKEIIDKDIVQKKYINFADDSVNSYMLYFSGIKVNLFIRLINKISGNRFLPFIVNRYKNNVRVGVRNYIECEAHRELLLKGLEKDVKKNTDIY